MYRRNILSLCAMTALGLTLIPGGALAQQKSLKDNSSGPGSMPQVKQFGPMAAG
jgi:hypothetical protein